MQIIYNNIGNIVVDDGKTDTCCVINPRGNFTAEIKENSSFKAVFLFTSTCDFNAEISLVGKHSFCDISALYLLKNTEKSTFTATVKHKTTESTSRQIIKGVADGKSSFNYAGIVDVDAHAIKTDAEQLHMGLLLSDNAKITVSPQLMIRADDVKCSHGSAVGDLDKNQMFYLRSRGINEQDARNILISAFFTEILEKIVSIEARKICYKELGFEYDE